MEELLAPNQVSHEVQRIVDLIVISDEESNPNLLHHQGNQDAIRNVTTLIERKETLYDHFGRPVDHDSEDDSQSYQAPRKG